MKRNANAVAAILENFDIAENVLKDSANAAGSALAENEKYLDSIAGKSAQFRAAFESLSVEVIDSDGVKLIIDAGTALVNLVTQLQKMGALVPAVAGIVSVFTGLKKSMEIGDLAGKIASSAEALEDNADVAQSLQQTIAALSGRNRKLLIDQINQRLASEGIDEAQRQQIISTLALDKAQDKLSVSAGNVGTGFMNMIRSIPKWQIAIMGITTVISVISAVKNHLEQVRQEAIDSANEISTAFDEADASCSRNIESLESLRDRYEKLAVSVGENGENIGLTASEYDEYLGIVKQISDISPQIIQGYDNEGRAILNYKSAIDDAVAAQEALLSTQKQTFLSGGRELFSGKKLEYGDVVKDLNSTLSVLDEYSSQATALANDYTLGNVDSNIAQAEAKANAVNIALQKINVSFGDTTAEMIAGARQLSENSHQFINLLRESGSFSNSELTDLQSDLYGLADQLESIGEITTSLSDYVWVWGESNNWFSEDLLNNAGAVAVLRDALQSLMDPNLSNTTNLDNAKTLVDSFNEMVGSEAVQDIVAMSDGLANGTTSIEAYNAAVANWWGSASGDPLAVSSVLSYLTSLSNKYVDVSATAEDAKEKTESLIDELTRLGSGGSVDLTNRPTISTNKLIDAGWDVDPDEIATVFSSTYSNEDGTVAINFTPIIVDENGNHIGTLSEDELTEYAEGVIAGTREDDLKLQIGSEFTGEDAIEQAETAAERIHDLHESLFPEGAYTSALNNFGSIAEKINTVSDSLKTVADLQNEVANGFTMSLDKALEFASVYPEILNGATVSADGQISLNEDVVNSFISGKEAELKSQIDEQIVALEADKETLEAKRAFAEAQLELAKSVGEGEGQISQDVAEYRVNAGNAVAEALINAGMQEADAYRLACAAMAGNAEEFSSVAADVCTDTQGNFNQAAYDAAQAIYLNMNRAKTDIASLAGQAQDAARAINGMQSGTVAGNAAIRGGSGGGRKFSPAAMDSSSGLFHGVTYQYDAITFELKDFISQLELDISEYESAISQIDGQIAALKALRDRDLGSFKTDKSSGSSGGGSGGGRGSSDADEVSDALENAEEALRDAFKDCLNDMEHYISLLERNNNSESSIIDAYKRMMDAVHEEAERARANGEDEHSDYIQELQDQWWAYHDEIEKIRDDITENAKSAVDELVDYRIDMLKQQLEEEKDALDAQLDELKEFYDKQKDMLREQYDEKKYLEEQSEKRKAVSDLEAELESLRYDDSAWAQKRRAELEAELADARKELEDFEEENALDEVEKLLDEQYEKQAALVQDQIDAIEEKLNDPEALFNQALADIRNSTEALYQEMVEYNAKHGDGNAETIRTFWEECFAALKDYEDLFGEAYNGVNMDNATGYEEQVGQVPTQGGGSTNTGSQATPSPAPSTPSTPSTPTAPSLEKGSYVQVKDGVKWYETSDGTGSWGRAKSGKIKYISKSGTHRYNIDGAGWVRKQDIVGYASGTSHATAGIHEFGENGDEVIFTSADGSKYRIFSDGEKVLNAKATNFLYDFANTFGGRNHAWDSLIGGILGQVNNIGSRDTTVEIHSGDIIVQGNADERTVSDIRRVKREQMNYILKEIGKLNK